MKKKPLLKKLFWHFHTIKANPKDFLLWIGGSIVIGLSPVWLPSLLGSLLEIPVWERTMESMPLIFFSIIFIANSVITTITTEGEDRKSFASGVRNVSMIILIILLIVLSSLSPLDLFLEKSISVNAQLSFFILSVLLGVYVYGFRDIEWEKTVDGYLLEAEKVISDISKKSNKNTNDGTGVAL